MKIPESVRIHGVEYSVQMVDYLNDGVGLAYGFIDYEKTTISLSGTANMSHQKQCVTLWHEILHGIQNANGLQIENEEAVIDMFAKGIYQVLQDNGRRLFDLKGKDNESMADLMTDEYPTEDPWDALREAFDRFKKSLGADVSRMVNDMSDKLSKL